MNRVIQNHVKRAIRRPVKSAAWGKIPLASGEVALVDDSDYLPLAWLAWSKTTAGYARSDTVPSMSRIIMECVLGRPLRPGEQIDHINGDRLDNRRSNLRLVTGRENAINRGVNSSSTSGYKGVSYHKLEGRFMARITVDGETIQIGYFDDPEDAAYAYDQFSLALHGEYGRRNILE